VNTPHWLTSGGCPEIEAWIGMHRWPKLFPSREAALAECVRRNQWLRRTRPDSDAHYSIEPYEKGGSQ